MTDVVWTHDIRFTPLPSRAQAEVNEIVIHGSATTSVERTVRVLKSRKGRDGRVLGLSTHIIIGPNGATHLTAELDTRAVHCHQHNGVSVGIDLVEPYYPRSRGARGLATWPRVIRAPWAHEGQYVLPTLASIHSLVEVVRYLTSPGAALNVPLHFVGVRPEGDGLRFRMGLLEDAHVRRPGIWAHHQAGDHADGAWPTLVVYLVLVQGRTVEAAYEEAAELATGARGWVPLPSPAEALTAAPVSICSNCGQARPAV